MSIIFHTPAGDMWLCFTCGKYYHFLFGDKCDACRNADEKHAEYLALLKKIVEKMEVTG